MYAPMLGTAAGVIDCRSQYICIIFIGSYLLVKDPEFNQLAESHKRM